MNEQARWNYQKGVPENRLMPAMTYTIESGIDSWIMSHEKFRQTILNKRLEEQEEQIANDIATKIESILCDRFASIR